jgi:PST family polysaccharide transporter
MNFRAFAIRTAVAVTLGGSLGLALALRGFGARALVAQQLATTAVGLGLYWVLSGWRPRLRFSPRAARDLLGFSTGTLIGRLGMFVNRRADALLMGLFFGPTAVGLYRLADPRHQDQPDRLRESFVRCVWISACLALPPLGVLAAGAPELAGLLGARWRDAAPALSASRPSAGPTRSPRWCGPRRSRARSPSSRWASGSRPRSLRSRRSGSPSRGRRSSRCSCW